MQCLCLEFMHVFLHISQRNPLYFSLMLLKVSCITLSVKALFLFLYFFSVYNRIHKFFSVTPLLSRSMVTKTTISKVQVLLYDTSFLAFLI